MNPPFVHLQADIVGVNEIFTDLGKLVYDQGETIGTLAYDKSQAIGVVSSSRDDNSLWYVERMRE